MTIGESIRYHRKKLNLTQSQLAERLSVTPQAVSKWESGAGLPDLSMAVPLARALGTTTDELLSFGERYGEFVELWNQSLRRDCNDYMDLFETALAALKEFPWDVPFLFRAAWSGRAVAETSDDPAVYEAYMGRAAAYAQLLVEMSPDNKTHWELRKDIFQKNQALWNQQQKTET